MKRMVLGCAALVLAATLPAAFAADARSKDEKNLDKEIARLERTASAPEGERAVVRRIAADFRIAEDAVRTLRGAGLGYGEIVIVYTLARALPGGITEANVGQVRALREGPPVRGWDAVAKGAGAKLGKVVSQLKKITNESHREMKQGQAKAAAPKKTAEPAEAQPPATKRFEGEGKLLERGPAAQ